MEKRTKQRRLPRLDTKAVLNNLCQVCHIVRNKVCQLAVFAMVPNLFNRIQFRRISRKPFHVHTITESALQPTHAAAMNHPSVDHQNDARREMLQQGSDKSLKIIGTDILVHNRKIQSQPTAFWRAGQYCDSRQPIPSIPTAQNRREPMCGEPSVEA